MVAPVENKVWLILDSGAYSAWNIGATIDLDDYIAYIKKNKHLLAHYVNLDVIPGKPGRPRTQAEVEESAAQSYKNLKYMAKRGLRPIPVFHQGERWYWLERLMAEGWDYIGISPMADLPSPVVNRWFDEAFTLTTDKGGKPIIRTHGFGVTAFKALWRYPWTTVDSTTWATVAGYGRILVPQYRGGVPDYTVKPLSVLISGVQSKAKTKGDNAKMQFESMGPLLQKHIVDFIESVGLSIYDARNDTGARMMLVCTYFRRLSEARPNDITFKHRRHGFLT